MTTDVITFACRSCKSKFQVKAAMAGRKSKCPKCGNVISVPKPAPAKAATVPQASSTPEVADEFGLGGPLKPDDDLFEGLGAPSRQNPLANHVVTDPGFAAVNASIPVADSDGGGDSYAPNPVLAAMHAERDKAESRNEFAEAAAPAKPKGANPLKSPAVLAGIVLGMGLFVAILVGFVMEAALGIWICVGVAILSGCAQLGGQVWGVLLINQHQADNKVLHILLFLFVPIYNVIYALMNWRTMKGYFGLLCVSAFCSSAAVVGMVILGIAVAASNM